MGQTKVMSLKEACTSTAIGYVINLVLQMVFFPAVGVKASFSQNIKIGLLFTLVSVARQYWVRRQFNKFPGRASE
jgi:hypothetical protein